MRAKAFVFDFDGLIIDTESGQYLTVSEEFEVHGASLSLEDWQAVVGTEHRHWLDWLEDLVGPVDRDVVQARRARRHHEIIAGLDLRPGVMEILVAARRANVAVTVASSSPRDWVEGHLRERGIFEYFHAVRCGGEVPRTKPAPDLFVAVLDAVGVDPADAVAFEDSYNGSTAAKAAGLYTVVVPNDITRSQSFDHVDLLLGSLADFPLGRFIAPAI